MACYRETFTFTRSTTFLGQAAVPQPVKKFPAFQGTRKFITMFTKASHLSLVLVSCIQSTHSHPTHPRNILISSLYQRLRISLRFPHQSQCIRLSIPRTRAICPAHLILLTINGPFLAPGHITTYSAAFFKLKCRRPCRLIYDLTLDTGNSLLFSGYPPSAAAADSTVCDTNLETAAATIRCFHRLLTVQQSTDADCGVCR